MNIYTSQKNIDVKIKDNTCFYKSNAAIPKKTVRKRHKQYF